MARTKQVRRVIESVSQANVACDQPNGGQGTDKDILAPKSVVEKVMARDGTVEDGKNLVQGQFYGARSCRNNLQSFFAINIGSYSSSSWKNVFFTVRRETFTAKGKHIPFQPELSVTESS